MALVAFSLFSLIGEHGVWGFVSFKIAKPRLSLFALPPPVPPISSPVYALSVPLSSGQNDESTNMCIVTYAAPVSLATNTSSDGIPFQYWAVSVKKHTCTHQSFLKNKVGIIQLMKPEQIELVEVLGKHSGHDRLQYSKREKCAQLGFPWKAVDAWNEYLGVDCDVLSGCASYMGIRFDTLLDAGDHDMVLCRGVWLERHIGDDHNLVLPLAEQNVLYSEAVRDAGILPSFRDHFD
eukprot:CAMPEP_0118687562 /NCGR_PEP_ID=MMETSP0800-20121206/8452_1 /TAXON_ID=210618 ORGANISM="Striatella unipunctata, Strain CCMP2910" /NCGR_SAMPLE_ID=MMETSP0800 /ASSEMBLY_ACC=CAM_ASM_000638 /LENGTH=235 /DNA_ID=CAMNT_0006584761 /DNA_START=52 /DNA_END=759 /DNA_ORIENTATION=-